MTTTRPIQGPVREPDRLHTIDALRGFALLGIFVPNLFTFAFPLEPATSTAAFDPTPSNTLAIWLTDVLFTGKYMLLFAMLFGAGAWLMGRAYDERNDPLHAGSARWIRRCAVLTAIGAFHALFIWYGDILVTYSLCGLAFLWWVRRLPPGVLIAMGIASHAVGALVGFGFAQLARGPLPDPTDPFQLLFMLPPEGQIALYREGFDTALAARLPNALTLWLALPFTLFWMVAGLMLIGVALARLGVLTGRLSARAYALMAILGYPIGLAATLALRGPPAALGGEFLEFFFLSQIAGFPITIANISVIALIVKARGTIARAVAAGLTAVGRTAFSNYLGQSLVASVLFYGSTLGIPSLGLIGRIDFPALWLVVAAVWAACLTFSTLWLRAFTMGPAEWLWRGLTDWRLHPIRRRGPQHPSAVTRPSPPDRPAPPESPGRAAPSS